MVGVESGTGSMLAWLTSLEPADLSRVLSHRPDVLRPPEPRSLIELSERLGGSAHSLVDALRSLPMPCVHVVEAVMALGDAASLDELSRLLDDSADPERHAELVAHWLRVLTDHAIVWLEGEERLGRADALTAIFPSPLGLGPTLGVLIGEVSADPLRRILKSIDEGKPPTRRAEVVAELHRVLGDPEAVRRIVGSAPKQVAEELLVWAAEGGGPATDFDEYLDDEFDDGSYDDEGDALLYTPFDPAAYARRSAAATWAAERGLVFVRGWAGRWQMPAEVSRALRGPQFRSPFRGTPPTVDLRPVDGELVANQSMAAVSRFADLSLAVADRLARTAVPALKSRGIGTRELTKLHKAIGADEPEIRLVLELCAAVGVIELAAGRWQLSEAGKAWRSSQPADRIAAMLTAWWDLPSAATQSRDADGKATPALAASQCVGCLLARQNLFHTMAQLGEHEAGDSEQIARRALWRRPFVHVLPQDVHQPFGSVFAEANMLGVVALGVLSGLGRALVGGEHSALHQMLGDALPAANDRALFGADLTVVVAGAPTAEVSRLLDAAADRESRGGATVWRFTPGSIRRALDEGTTAAALEDQLAAIATDELPQSLSYLIGDIGRRHGSLRVSSVSSVVRSDDEALLRQVAADRALRKLGLRVIAPSVLAADADNDTVLAALRQAGYLPMPEGETAAIESSGTPRAGHVQASQRQDDLVAAREWHNRVVSRASADPDALAARLLGSPHDQALLPSPTERQLSADTRLLSASEIQILADAIDLGVSVVIDYRSQSGNMTRREITPMQLSGSAVLAWCGLRNDERWFRIDRIHSVLPSG